MFTHASRPRFEAELLALATHAFRGLGLRAAMPRRPLASSSWASSWGSPTHGVERIESYGERLDLGGHQGAPRHPRRARGAGLAQGRRRQRRGAARGHARARSRDRHGARNRRRRRLRARQQPFRPGLALLAASRPRRDSRASSAATPPRPSRPGAGATRGLGNSPVGFCVPNPGGRPILLDMALTVVARAKIRNAAKRGEAIPSTWATDSEGKPTTDPNAPRSTASCCPSAATRATASRSSSISSRGCSRRVLPHARELVVRQSPDGAAGPRPLLHPRRRAPPRARRSGSPQRMRDFVAHPARHPARGPRRARARPRRDRARSHAPAATRRAGARSRHAFAARAVRGASAIAGCRRTMT